MLFQLSYNFFKAKELIAILTEANQVINPKLIEMAQDAKSVFGKGRPGRGGSGEGLSVYRILPLSTLHL